jgi:flagellar protein FliS
MLIVVVPPGAASCEGKANRMTTTAHEAYRTVSASTADPITLTTMLYDGALKAIRKARLFQEQGNRQRFLDETGRAHLIVGELLATLDREQGGELAVNMASLYSYCIRCLVEATLGDLSKLDEVEKHIGRIAQAWRQAAAGFRSSAQAPSAAVA